MNPEDRYKTIIKNGEGDFRDRGSKFPSCAFYCESDEQLKEHLQALKRKHPQARHFCYGAILGLETSEERSSDDGEPSGTAGLPILNQLQSAGLKNSAVVVVRYFGGTKLGKPGLINAYKESALDALRSAHIGERYISVLLMVDFPYDATGDVTRKIEQLDQSEIVEHVYEQRCSILFRVPKSTVNNALHLFDYSNEISIQTMDSN